MKDAAHHLMNIQKKIIRESRNEAEKQKNNNPIPQPETVAKSPVENKRPKGPNNTKMVKAPAYH